MMFAQDKVTDSDVTYAVQVRRHLHQHPEIGFDLDDTAAYVGAELTKNKIAWTADYGKCSLSAYVGQPSASRTLAFRADKDALPVVEKTNLPYASLVHGRMHACGHDAHTGILLSVARILKRHQDELPCRVKLLFQPNEEGEPSGARMMMEAGAVDDVDLVLCTHCDNALESGVIGVHAGDYMAACDPITIRFHGKTAHATLAEQGIDAIAMAIEAYPQLISLVENRANGHIPYVFSVGCLQGGAAHNIIADSCEMKISFRYYSQEFASCVKSEITALCRQIAASRGGTVTFHWEMSAPPVHNDEMTTQRLADILSRMTDLCVMEIPRRMSSEDFSWFLTRKPGMIFRFGTRNEAKECTALAHCNDFRLAAERLCQ